LAVFGVWFTLQYKGEFCWDQRKEFAIEKQTRKHSKYMLHSELHQRSLTMKAKLNVTEKAYTFEASSFTAACVVATLLGGGFYSLWQDGKQVMPAFVFGGVEKWYQRTFGKNFLDVVQEVSPDEISQIYLTILVGKPEERQRYLQELSIIHHSKPALVSATSQWRPQIKPTPYGSCKVPDGDDVVQLLDGRELPAQEILGEIGTNLWLVDLLP
jgi:hypothetical protein